MEYTTKKASHILGSKGIQLSPKAISRLLRHASQSGNNIIGARKYKGKWMITDEGIQNIIDYEIQMDTPIPTEITNSRMAIILVSILTLLFALISATKDGRDLFYDLFKQENTNLVDDTRIPDAPTENIDSLTISDSVKVDGPYIIETPDNSFKLDVLNSNLVDSLCIASSYMHNGSGNNFNQAVLIYDKILKDHTSTLIPLLIEKGYVNKNELNLAKEYLQGNNFESTGNKLRAVFIKLTKDCQ